MLPKVILHNAVSVDGRMDRLKVDLALFYSMLDTWREQATLVGSATIAAAYKQWGGAAGPDATAAADTPASDKPERLPWLVIPDSRGRLRCWEWLLRQPYWRGGIALCSARTPTRHLRYLDALGIARITYGVDKVDLRPALEELRAEFKVRTVRADCGGKLNGALLRASLVNEVSVVICPTLTGGITPASMYVAPNLVHAGGNVDLRLLSVQELSGGHVWLRYAVVKPQLQRKRD